jgi:hypothetical protein
LADPAITAAAAIEATLPEGREAEVRPDGKGGYLSRCRAA